MNQPVIRHNNKEPLNAYEIILKDDANSYPTVFQVSCKGWRSLCVGSEHEPRPADRRLSTKLYTALFETVKCLGYAIGNYMGAIQYSPTYSAYRLIKGPNWVELCNSKVRGNLIGNFRITGPLYAIFSPAIDDLITIEGFDRYDKFTPCDVKKYSSVSEHYLSEEVYSSLINLLDNSIHRIIDLFAAVYDDAPSLG